MAKRVKQDPAARHNPTAAERDERVIAPDVDPEEFLEALLQVDPESEPVDEETARRRRIYESVMSTTDTLEELREVNKGWEFVETVETTGSDADTVKVDFWERHPELRELDPRKIRIDEVLGRDSRGSDLHCVELRFWVRSDAMI